MDEARSLSKNMMTLYLKDIYIYTLGLKATIMEEKELKQLRKYENMLYTYMCTGNFINEIAPVSLSPPSPKQHRCDHHASCSSVYHVVNQAVIISCSRALYTDAAL